MTSGYAADLGTETRDCCTLPPFLASPKIPPPAPPPPSVHPKPSVLPPLPPTPLCPP